MKFSTRYDLEAPIAYVFERSTDFKSIERQGLRRGINIERADDLRENGVGMSWKAEFSYRGKPRRVQALLADYDAPERMLIQSVSGGIAADFEVEFFPLSRNRTRIRIGLQMLPNTLPARLLVQSLKFAKSNLDERFANRVEQFCTEIEDSYRQGSDASAKDRRR